jgi:drug/metabolite transporter (DMT)-like permease
MLLFATSFPATDALLEFWRPIPVAIGRLFVGGVFLCILVVAMGRAKEVRSAPWWDVFWIGGGFFGATTILIVYGIHHSNPVTAAVIVAMIPPVSAVIGYVSGEERVTSWLVFGIVLAVTGGVWTSVGNDLVAWGFEGGEPLLMLAVPCFVIFTRGSVRRLSMLSPLTQTALTTSAAGVVVSVVGGLLYAAGWADFSVEWSPHSIGLVLWIGAFSNGISLAFWLAGAAYLGITVAAVHQNLVPFYVIVIALSMGGGVANYQVWGALLVVAGAVATQIPGLTAKKEPISP